MSPDVRVFDDTDELSRRAAAAAADAITAAVAKAGRCALVLAGGNTPRTMYGVLASRFHHAIPWAQVHVFWGDERYVPDGDPRSNYRMAMDSLLAHVPCPRENVHPMPTHLVDPEAAAREYETTLRGEFSGEWPRFHLVLLGLGPEGHTASLFPESPALDETTRWVRAVTVPADPPSRLTLTLPALARSASTYFLVAGSSKARALRAILEGTVDVKAHPAAGVRPLDGTVTWWVDRAAAGRADGAVSPRDADQ